MHFGATALIQNAPLLTRQHVNVTQWVGGEYIYVYICNTVANKANNIAVL